MTEERPAHVFVQWKGTDICLDFTCPCGAMTHYDGLFAYVLRCPGCGRLWRMPDTFILEPTEDDGGAVLEESWNPDHPRRSGPSVVEVLDVRDDGPTTPPSGGERSDSQMNLEGRTDDGH